eukprot:2624554-Pleurochrysis_carterae.AAC.1
MRASVWLPMSTAHTMSEEKPSSCARASPRQHLLGGGAPSLSLPLVADRIEEARGGRRHPRLSRGETRKRKPICSFER